MDFWVWRGHDRVTDGKRKKESIEFWVGVLQNLKPDCSSLFLWQVSGVTQANTPPPQCKQTHAVPPTKGSLHVREKVEFAS